MPDITQTYDAIEEFGELPSATPWQLFFGPISPSIFIFLFLMLIYVRLGRFKLAKWYLPVLIYFVFIPLGTSLMYDFIGEGFSMLITDLKILFYFVFGIIIINDYFSKFPDVLDIFPSIFIGLLSANFLLDAIIYISGSYKVELSSTYSSLSYDSIKGLINVIIIFLAFSFTDKLYKNLIITAALLLSISMLIAYQTRWLIVTLILGLFLIFVYKGVIRSFKIIVASICIGGVGIFLLSHVAPEVLEVALLRFGFLSDFSNSDILEIEVARTGSIFNSISLVFDKSGYIFGMGYGSWYTDNYFPLPDLNIGAFDEASLASRKFYRVHDFFFHFFFKYGIVGIIFFCAPFIKPLIQIFKIRKKQPLLINDHILICMIGSLPTIMTSLYFTGKGLLLSAVFVVFFRLYVKKEIDLFINMSSNQE